MYFLISKFEAKGLTLTTLLGFELYYIGGQFSNIHIYILYKDYFFLLLLNVRSEYEYTQKIFFIPM